MTQRERLHRLIGELPEAELPAVLKFLEFLAWRAGGDIPAPVPDGGDEEREAPWSWDDPSRAHLLQQVLAEQGQEGVTPP